jgi:hypothetical protein
MCDTMGFLAEGKAYFAKNSDRSPNEPQVVEYHPAHGARGRLKATYLELDDREDAHAVLLSRPVWMWGAEMGVNECGVVIGNEAVFTKGAYGKTGLTGMDLLRLALERAGDAKSAVGIIAALLEQYGQGGNCGYDHDFYYDNSFLIADRNDIYVLETAGKRWTAKRFTSAAISNRLSLGAQNDLRGGGAREDEDFKKAHFEPVYSFFSGSKQRNGDVCASLSGASGPEDLMRALRAHAPGLEHPLCRASVKSVCMHAGGAIGDHTTQSMVVELGDIIKVWVTGSSTPCISLFKPYALGSPAEPPVFAPDDPAARAYWLAHERFHRGLIGKIPPQEYYAERGALEESWLAEARDADTAAMRALSQRAAGQEAAFYDKWAKTVFQKGNTGASFLRYWRKKNAALA